MSDPRAAILAAASALETVPVDGFPGAFIKRVSIRELDEVTAAEKESGLVLLRFALVDEFGKALFTADDHEALSALPAALSAALPTALSAALSATLSALPEPLPDPLSAGLPRLSEPLLPPGVRHGLEWRRGLHPLRGL